MPLLLLLIRFRWGHAPTSPRLFLVLQQPPRRHAQMHSWKGRAAATWRLHPGVALPRVPKVVRSAHAGPDPLQPSPCSSHRTEWYVRHRNALMCVLRLCRTLMGEPRRAGLVEGGFCSEGHVEARCSLACASFPALSLHVCCCTYPAWAPHTHTTHTTPATTPSHPQPSCLSGFPCLSAQPAAALAGG